MMVSDEEHSRFVKKQVKLYWPQYRQSATYQEVADFPDQMIQQAMTLFLSIISVHSPKQVSHWTISDVAAAFPAIVNGAPESVTPTDVMNMLGISDNFVRWLIKAHILLLDEDLLRSLISQEFEVTSNIPGTEETEINDLQLEINPDLPKYSLRIAENIQDYMGDWVCNFINPQTGNRCRPNVSEDDAEFYVANLVGRIYDEYRKTPKAWTKYAVSNVLTGYFVTDLVVERSEYSDIAETLLRFMDFLEKHHFLRTDLIKRTKRAIIQAEPVMVELANDESQYSKLKVIRLTMKRAGVDLDDSDAVQAYFDRHPKQFEKPTPQPSHEGRVISMAQWKKENKKHQNKNHPKRRR